MAKVTCITTIYNEAATIETFLSSLMAQTRLPDEIVIVDAYSTDGTWEKVQDFFQLTEGAPRSRIKSGMTDKVKIQLLQKKGNRSVGRNYAISHATHDIIVATDAGCILDTQWCAEITKPFDENVIANEVRQYSQNQRHSSEDPHVAKAIANAPQDDTSLPDVVSGFYLSGAQTVFQKCLAAYTCVMPEKVNPYDFLPSSRSVAFTKQAWENAGKYPEELDYCEDLVFATNLRTMGAHMVFAREAVVFWPQKKNLWQAAKQFYHYAYGDGQARYIRGNTPFLFARYMAGIIFLSIALWTRDVLLLDTLLILFILYILWAIKKNDRFVKHPLACLYLPLLQFTADVCVISGMIVGLTTRR